MSKVYDVVAVIREEGREKPRYVNCGAAFRSDKGGLSIKLNSLPAGAGWNGWLSLFEPKPKDAAPKAAADDFDDSLTF